MLGVGALALALGAGAGIALAPSSIKTITRTLAGATRTVTRVRTGDKVRTRIERVIAPRTVLRANRAPAAAGVRPAGQAQPAGRSTSQRFVGSGNKLLGTITLRQPVTTVRWTNSGGRFRLQYDGTGVAVDSTAHAGSLAAPPLNYRQVTVLAPGRWTIQIG